ncbi:MAG: endonuclease/exonuclease/phosphatase family protein [Candidatus Eremiobacteraeota bacterium]|nr:endonuclease/exonuclease/phosphatase family protein [Candidatus Eremiobacteraeota bacterium]
MVLNLRVLTLNIRCDTGVDGDFNWVHRRERVFELLKQSRADIIALQEVLPNQRQDLEENLPAFQWLGRGRDFGGGGEQCALGISPHLSIQDEGVFWLSDTPRLEGTVGWDACLPRICCWAEIASPSCSGKAVIANTHFDHLGTVARTKSAELMASMFTGVSGILLGDFNCGPRSAPIRHLSHNFHDVLEFSEEATYHEFGRLPRGPRIDYILVDREVKIHRAEIVAESEPYCSDHFAILAELEVG